MKLTFKKGLITGVVLSILFLIIGDLYLDQISERAKQVASIDVNTLEYRNLNDEVVQLSEVSANKNIFINYWATWCKPCLEEFPLMNEVANKTKDDFVFIVVSSESIEKIKNFSQKKDYDFIYLQTESFLTKGINPIPQSYILDKGMNVKKHHPGPIEGNVKQVMDSLQIWIN